MTPADTASDTAPAAADAPAPAAAAAAENTAPTAPAIDPVTSRAGTIDRRLVAALAVTLLLAVAALALVWRTQQRVQGLEQELVRRQQESQNESAEARRRPWR